MPTTIEPTVGRIVWFYENGGTLTQPLAAIITAVHNDFCVNLCAFSDGGAPMGYSSVPLHQGDEERPHGFFCEWMPYQKGQAAKTEALESELSKSATKEP